MTDNELYAVLFGILDSAFTGLAEVLQSNQPTQQGVPTAPTIFLTKLFDNRYGHVQREDKWDEAGQKMIHTERVVLETTFQLSGLAVQDPSDTTKPTASDLVRRAATVMQASATLETLRQNGLGVLRIGQIRNPYIVDDKERFEASPSFDFVITRTETTITETPFVEVIDAAIYPV